MAENNEITLSAGLRQTRRWLEKQNLEIFTVSMDEQAALQVPLTVNGTECTLFVAEFDDDQNPDLKLLAFNMQLADELEDGDECVRLLGNVLKEAISIGHLSAEESTGEVTFDIVHIVYQGQIPDAVLKVIYDEFIKVLEKLTANSMDTN